MRRSRSASASAGRGGDTMSSKATLSDLLRDTHLGPDSAAHLARAVINMGVRYPSVFTNAALAVVPANGAETVILTTPPLTLPLDGAAVFLGWFYTPTTGLGTTAAGVRIRRGTLVTSPLINGGNAYPATANSGLLLAGWFVDTPGSVAGVQYSLTVTGTGTTGVWSNAGADAILLAFAL